MIRWTRQNRSREGSWMNSCGMKIRVALAVILASGACLAMPASGQPIAVSVDPSAMRVLPEHFYGANGQNRGEMPWDQIDPSTGQPYNPGFASALRGLRYGILRFPAGTGANYWDWRTGQPVTNYGPTTPSLYPSPLPELKRELRSASQPGGIRTRGDYVLNMLSDPLCVPSGQTYCTYSTSSPDEAYQLELLRALAAESIDVAYLELGNEYYGGSATSDYAAVYPTVEDYTTVANSWIKRIKSKHPALKIAAVAANSGPASTCASGTRKDTWNCGLMQTLAGADAVVLHIYPASGLPQGSAVDNDTAETMLLTPLTTWDQIVGYDFPSLVNTSSGYRPAVWFTEYNLKDQTVNASGTWAHGLYVATLSLLFVSNPRVRMALNHDVYATGLFTDIFASADVFQSRYKLPIPTTVNAYSAKGLTTREVDTAALGKTCAAALTFPGAPTFDGTHPKLVGEMFTGGSSNDVRGSMTPSDYCFQLPIAELLSATESQIVVLNLDNAAHAVSFRGLLSQGSYQQIHGKAGSYVDGKVLSSGFEGYDADLSPANLTLTANVLNPRWLWLPPFSITRIVAGPNPPPPAGPDLPE